MPQFNNSHGHFKLMDSAKRRLCVHCLTEETANTLHKTLTGTVEITKTMLRAHYSKYAPWQNPEQ